MDVRSKNQTVYQTGFSPVFGALALLLLSLALLGLNFDARLRAHVPQFLFVNATALLSLGLSLFLLKRLLQYRISADEEGLTQRRFPGRSARMRWEDIRAVKFSYGDGFLYLYSGNKKIWISLKTKHIESLLHIIKTHVSDSVTKDAFHLIKGMTFIDIDH